MRLKTRLVVAVTLLTLVIVLVPSSLFLRELLRQRVQQTNASTVVMARQVLMMTVRAVEEGLTANPPTDRSDEAFHAAVADALRSYQPLTDTMNSFVRYSSAVQDVSVTDARGWTLVSTDPQTFNQPAPTRLNFDRLQLASTFFQARQVFGRAHVLEVTSTLNRNGAPFLIVRIGVRSSFLKDNYVPWFYDALVLVVLCALLAIVSSAIISSMSLRAIQDINRRLVSLTPGRRDDSGSLELTDGQDAMVRVTETIDRLDRQMQTKEAVYSSLQASLDQMLDTLRDGVVLFNDEARAMMISDAVAKFLGQDSRPMVGLLLDEIFPGDSMLGRAVRAAYRERPLARPRRVRLEDGREVEFLLDRIDSLDRSGGGATLLTLRDRGSAMQLEQELDVSRRLAAIGRLTAGVGHEVKNPINAMVVHLELLRSKLQIAGEGRSFLAGAQKHVEIIAGEMHRLDRVVQTLADFTRPMDLHLAPIDLSDVVDSVVELTSAEMALHQVEVRCKTQSLTVRADGELLRQALLNLMLNGMQAMAAGGILQVRLRREGDDAVIEVEDNGEGIAPGLMPKIFDLYFTTKPKGSGIGLAMSYRIVQMHGGSMDVSSVPGAGATFSVTLPLSLEAEARDRGRIAAGRLA